MKYLFILLTAIFLFASCGKENIKPKGEIESVEIQLNDFTGIDVAYGFNLFLTLGDEESVVVETYENYHQYIITQQKEGSISFKRDNKDEINGDLVNIYVTARNISSLVGSDGSDIIVTNMLDSETLSIVLSGGSTASTDIGCSVLSVVLSGGSSASFNGECDIASIVASGGSIFNDFNFITDIANCVLSGGSQINITVNDELTVAASGGSVVNYKGEATVTSQELSGGSRINRVP